MVAVTFRPATLSQLTAVDAFPGVTVHIPSTTEPLNRMVPVLLLRLQPIPPVTNIAEAMRKLRFWDSS